MAIQSLVKMELRDASAVSLGGRRTNPPKHFANIVDHSARMQNYATSVVKESATCVHLPLVMSVKILTFLDVKTAILIPGLHIVIIVG